MIIKNIKLTNFRNHKKFETSFSEIENLITGPNGAGKTNILEAVNLLSTGKSFRAKYDFEMIYNPEVSAGRKLLDIFDGQLITKPFAKTSGTVENKDGEDSLEVIVIRENPETILSRKTYKVNGTNKRISSTGNLLSTVLFTPQDLELFTGSPSLRRKFLNDILYIMDPKYKKEHTTYTKSVRQRNKVLEKINKTGSGRGELSIWTEKILQSGVYIQHKRSELLEMLTPMVEKVYGDVSSEKPDIRIEYKKNEISSERLHRHAEHEIYAKTTLVGPHRDDFILLVNSYDLSSYGSRGQQRTAVIAFKISELDILETEGRSRPVLLLDDIFSELDGSHKNALKEVVQRQQTLITSTHPDDYLHSAGNMQILL